MPHLSIEYSRGLESRADVPTLCRALHTAMVKSGIFPLAGIRVRAHKADFAIVADALETNDFAAMTLTVGSGRSTEALKASGELIFAAARSALAPLLATQSFALSLEIRASDPELSWKDTPIHARLSGRSGGTAA